MSLPPSQMYVRCASPPRSPCAFLVILATRSSLRARMPREHLHSRWCNGCGSAGGLICKSLVFPAPKPGWTLIRGFAPCATASNRGNGSVPELTRRNPGSFRHGSDLRPDDVPVYCRLTHPGAIAAVAAGHDVLAADELGVMPEALRDEFR